MSKRGQAKPATLTDVARLAGVSIPTASRALNGGVRGDSSGNQELRERVRVAARELGYSVNPAAQAVKGGRARTIALVVSDMDDFGSATMIAGVMHAAETRGVSVAVRTTHDDARREDELLKELRGERHRGIVFATSRTVDAVRERDMDENLRVLQDQGAQIVIIGDSVLPYPSVVINNQQAAEQLATGLFDAGHRRFAIVAGPAEQVTSEDRVRGFLDGLEKRGLDTSDVQVVHVEFSRNGGYAALEELATDPGSIDVIAAMSDAMAVGVIAALRDDGVDPAIAPEVSGFDHVPMLGDVLPDFSTVEVPLEEFGEAALSLVFESEPVREVDPRTIQLEARPVVHGRSLVVKDS
ncbi:LacI family DNA-binding transcriptional regulator [Microbacterium sp. NPDC056234]|uniref:LacI family DNA-binding transcriptional regulator n=1 Tax=Microbacterium sp. NPDC056234 TaxID=3345757 RepID=UPI0035D90387